MATTNPSIDLFDRVSKIYDRSGPRFFSYFGEFFAEELDIPIRASILDLACGKGAALFPAVRRSGAEGQAIGVDLSERMLHEAQKEAQREGLLGIHTRCMDAQQLDFPDQQFDLILCGFAINLFSNPRAVLEEAYRVLKPGGKIALSYWARDCEYFRQMFNILKEYATAPPQNQDSLADPAILQKTLVETGFQNIRCLTAEQDFFYTDAEEWWSSLWSYGFNAVLTQISPMELKSLKQDSLEKIESVREDLGIRAALRAHLTVGTKLSGKNNL